MFGFSKFRRGKKMAVCLGISARRYWAKIFLVTILLAPFALFAKDEQAIRGVVQQYADAWFFLKPDQMDALTLEQFCIVNQFGYLSKKEEELQQIELRVGGMYLPKSQSIEIKSIEASERIAQVSIDWTRVGYDEEAGRLTEKKRRTLLVLEKEKGRWLVLFHVDVGDIWNTK